MIFDFNKYSNRYAIIDEDGLKYTYEMLFSENQMLANIIGQRCLVFILCTNRIGSIIGYTTCLNNNIIPLLLSNDIDKMFLQDLIEIYKPRYLWLPDEGTESLELCNIVYRKYGYSLVELQFNERYLLNKDLGLLLTTSGSTGSPKLVKQSYVNILSNATSIIQYLGIAETNKAIATLPMNYTYGLSIINSHLISGATILLTEKTLFHLEFWNFFKKEQATTFGGVPYTYEILKRIKFFNMNLPSLRIMTQAGGKLSPELQVEFSNFSAAHGIKFFIMYGQTEATARMSYLPCAMAVEKIGSIGNAIPGGKLSLIDDNGNEVMEHDVVGELRYEGPNVTMGYALGKDDLAKPDDWQGVLMTGDLAKKDQDGFFYIVGRRKRFVKIYGHSVNLDEIEIIIRSKFDQIECACSGIDNQVYIFITDTTLIYDVKEYISDKLKMNPSSFSVTPIKQIPKNNAGKILYNELNHYYENQ
ncbi:MAG: Long-chain-fatty-acid--CoA ligase [Herbinix sp.]|jgi:acyl-coenzyme A synthetase/AMP-(fatty) acid ligase|nr:Long-chain-fatty-acid--CoA ligase [Herbinix sp.]